MDYDSTPIPQKYRSARQLPAPTMRAWLSAIRRSAPLRPGSRVVDVGCGTGRFSVGLAEAYSSHVVGLDNSAKMLAEVLSSDERVCYCIADARALPLRGGSVGMVFLSNVVHHLADFPKAAEGFAHVLERGGFVVVRNYVREQLRDVPYLEFFPEAHAASVSALASGREIGDTFRRAGLTLFSHQSIRQPVAASPIEYLSKVQSRVYSDLAEISDDAFEAGVARMAAAVSDGWNRSLCEPIALFSFRKSLR
jgi:ubiquinone/menaquinone biosynthesis C-methylase UbiE